MAIDYVTDTLGRVVSFQYDSDGRLTSITKPGFGGTSQNPITETVVQFDYQTLALNGNFGICGGIEYSSGNNQAVKHIYFPATGTGMLLSYSAYGMIYRVSLRRQMYINGQGLITDGVESAKVEFNYPVNPATLPDVPSFTQRTETPGGVYSYSPSGFTFTVTRPDSSQLVLTRGDNGLLTQSEIKSGAGVSMAKSVYTYANDPGGFPQVQSVTRTTGGVDTKTDFDYNSLGSITNFREYGDKLNGVWVVRRRTRFVYGTGYLARDPVELDIYNANDNTSDADDILVAKTTLTYDNYAAVGGLENYGGTANPPGHNSSYGASFTRRRNITGRTEYFDLAGAGQAITRLYKWDIFGTVVRAEVACCNVQVATCTESNCWSEPTEITNGDPAGVHLTTSRVFDFNTSAVTSATSPNNQTTTYGYDAAMRLTSALFPTGASTAAIFSDGSLTSSNSVTFTEGGVNKTLTTTRTHDGWGRVIQVVGPNGGQVNTSYDLMGRVASVTNPFQSGQTPGPATTYQYDALGRLTVTTLPDGQTLQKSYSGLTVTSTDQVGRQMRHQSDGLGRLWKVFEQTPPDSCLRRPVTRIICSISW